MALGKSHVDYWKKRLTKRRFKRADGEEYENGDYEIRIAVDGKRTYFNLGSANREIAARKAQEIWEFYRANGGTATLQKFKQDGKVREFSTLTVGDLLSAHRELSLIAPRTLETYERKFRKLVSDVAGIPSPATRHDCKRGGRKIWCKKVDAVRLADLTPEKLIQWRAGCLKAAKSDPLSQRTAKVTADSILRNGKALFSKRALNALPFRIDVSPFEGVPIGSASTRRHKSEVDFKKLAEAARSDLTPEIPSLRRKAARKAALSRTEAVSKHQQFKILLLSQGCGLRRGEIDSLLWENMDFEKRTIHVTTSAFGSPKSEGADRFVDVSPEVLELLKAYKKSEESPFVIVSQSKPRPDVTYYYYRCDRHFAGLIKWLRKQGITKTNAIHALRAEYGSTVCQQFGIYAASRALGHSNVSITAASYLDKRDTVAVSLF
jgi:integrase